MSKVFKIGANKINNVGKMPLVEKPFVLPYKLMVLFIQEVLDHQLEDFSGAAPQNALEDHHVLMVCVSDLFP